MVPAGSLVLGVPARIVRAVTPAESERVDGNWRSYVELARAYGDGRIEPHAGGRR